MASGVNRKVVEILEPNHEYIERVIVFFRPNLSEMKLEKQQEEAERYAWSLRCIPKRSRWKFLLPVLAILAAAAVLFWYFFR